MGEYRSGEGKSWSVKREGGDGRGNTPSPPFEILRSLPEADSSEWQQVIHSSIVYCLPNSLSFWAKRRISKYLKRIIIIVSPHPNPLSSFHSETLRFPHGRGNYILSLSNVYRFPSTNSFPCPLYSSFGFFILCLRQTLGYYRKFHNSGIIL